MINTSKKCNLQSLFILLTAENAQKFSELILQKNVTNKISKLLITSIKQSEWNRKS